MGSQTSRHWECEPPVLTFTANGCGTNSSLDPRHAAALSARAKKTALQIAAAQGKAEIRDRQHAEKVAKHSAKKEEMRRKIAEAETEAQELKRKRVAAEIERTERKVLERKVEKEAREERRRRDERRRQEEDDEKRRRRHLGGVVWGFDDCAGKRHGSSSEASDGCYVSDGRAEECVADDLHEIDEIGRRTGRRWHRGNTWGVEAGGPGKEVVFEFGVPIDREKPKKLGSWRRRT